MRDRRDADKSERVPIREKCRCSLEKVQNRRSEEQNRVQLQQTVLGQQLDKSKHVALFLSLCVFFSLCISPTHHTQVPNLKCFQSPLRFPSFYFFCLSILFFSFSPSLSHILPLIFSTEQGMPTSLDSFFKGTHLCLSSYRARVYH